MCLPGSQRYRSISASLKVRGDLAEGPHRHLSLYLRRNRAEYYDRLMAVRNDGNWEGWLRFFLRGIAETAEEATESARAMVRLGESHGALLRERGPGANGPRLLDLLFRRPLVNVSLVMEALGVTDVTASRLVERLVALDLLEELTGRCCNRIFRYTPYWRLLEEPEADGDRKAPPGTTEYEL